MRHQPFSHCPGFMTIGENQNQDQFKNWPLCGFENSLFCDHREMKPRELHVLHQSVYKSPFPPTVTRTYHPRAPELLDLLQCIVAYLPRTMAWVSGETLYLVFFQWLFSFILGRTQLKSNHTLKAPFIGCKQHHFVKSKRLIPPGAHAGIF